MNKDLFEISEGIDADYCPSSDTTYIVKEVYQGDELISREVVGFYSGRPNKRDTETFIGKLKAEYTL